MKPADNLLLQVLRTPESVAGLSLREWDLVVRQARFANLLARLYMILTERDLLKQVPPRPQAHLESTRLLAGRQKDAVRWEVNRIRQAFAMHDIPVILLKGAAYVLAELPAANGRLFSDIDIIVDKNKLKTAESALLLHGWVTTHLDEYDQHYYRTWMHEIPPLEHHERKSILDVHHAILPKTARIHPDTAKLLAAITPVKGHDNVYTLAPADMVLHSATHLFHDGELEHGLRDLVDLDALLRHFGKDDDFWEKLTARAKEIDLIRPLFYALRYTTRFLETPVPDITMQAASSGSPSSVLLPLMDALFTRGLAPAHSSCEDWFTGKARWMLYVRSHFLRMPMHLLVPHLVRKTIRRKLDNK